MKIVAIIPARGGSKGIPKKNITPFSGYPLLVWTIRQAKESPHISDVYVSSDDNEILRISEKHGAKTITRPSDISDDFATSESSLVHAIQNMNKPDAVIFLQATSPLREVEDINGAIEKFKKEKMDSLFSASPMEDFFIWSVKENDITSYNYDYENRKRRQDISEQVVENGSFYIFLPHVLQEKNNRLGGKIGYYLMDKWKMHEIDSLDDLALCEFLFAKKGLDKK